MHSTPNLADLQSSLERTLEKAPSPLNALLMPLSDYITSKIMHWRRCFPIQAQWSTVQTIPFVVPEKRCVNAEVITASHSALSKNRAVQTYLRNQLLSLVPWRKGPFNLHGIFIDTEWKSYKKWERLLQIMKPIEGKRVLDVGCGSGYYLWRAYGSGASYVLGIDPTPLFFMQYHAVNRLLGGSEAINFLPVPLEVLPKSGYFDVVFSMGVLYHRISPLDHLFALKKQLRSGGELYLETLVHTEVGEQLLFPRDRYAKMRNVFFIPSPDLLVCWLHRVGFRKIVLGEINITSTEEQRRTEWIRGESLRDFLSSEDLSKTYEGYPAPRRLFIRGIRP